MAKNFVHKDEVNAKAICKKQKNVCIKNTFSGDFIDASMSIFDHFRNISKPKYYLPTIKGFNQTLSIFNNSCVVLTEI